MTKARARDVARVRQRRARRGLGRGRAGAAVCCSCNGTPVIVTLPRPARTGDSVSLAIAYHGAPKFDSRRSRRARRPTPPSRPANGWWRWTGRPTARRSISRWPCRRAARRGEGRETGTRTVNGRTVVTGGRIARSPASCSDSAGAFTEARAAAAVGAVSGAGSPRPSSRPCSATRAMVGFRRRAGVHPGESHAQALVATSGGQELAGLSHMSEADGRSYERRHGGLAHRPRAAHQWWGSLVTNREWTHF